MSDERVMLLIDADNVSIDVIEQAVQQLLEEHGALHVRRAYCTAESALKHQAVFKRLGIRPMVNLAAGKNSTNIALAVDAIDLVLAERPEVVVIASSDSDFAPLVGRLREKGCRVVGIGQEGKTGDETRAAYDEFTTLAHRPAQRPAERSARAAPAPVNAMMVGVYYLSLFAGSVASGWLGRFYEAMSPARFWLMHGTIVAAAVALILLLRRPLLRALNAAEQSAPEAHQSVAGASA